MYGADSTLADEPDVKFIISSSYHYQDSSGNVMACKNNSSQNMRFYIDLYLLDVKYGVLEGVEQQEIQEEILDIVRRNTKSSADRAQFWSQEGNLKALETLFANERYCYTLQYCMLEDLFENKSTECRTVAAIVKRHVKGVFHVCENQQGMIGALRKENSRLNEKLKKARSFRNW